MTADEFKALHQRTGMTYQKLAQALGCDPSTVWRYATGKSASIPSKIADQLRKLAAKGKKQ